MNAIHIPSVLNARRFAPHVYLPRIAVPNIKNGAIHILKVDRPIYHVLFYFLNVNCAF